jgi:hypothetical protein
MSPLKEIIGVNPADVDWQDARKGGGQKQPEIENAFHRVLQAINTMGAAKIVFTGNAGRGEAYQLGGTLRAKFASEGIKIQLREHDDVDAGNEEQTTELFIKRREI